MSLRPKKQGGVRPFSSPEPSVPFSPWGVLAFTRPLGRRNPNNSGDENGKRREKNSPCTSSPHSSLVNRSAWDNSGIAYGSRLSLFFEVNTKFLCILVKQRSYLERRFNRAEEIQY